MVNGCANAALRQVARVFHEGTLTGMSDRQMLERFVDGRDEAAFEVLVARHGPMVFNVCRQLVRDPHDVEDAFQAVFLVLVRKARTIRVEGSLGPWLYTVANRVAARARANRRRMATREVSAAIEVSESPADNSVDRLEAAVVIQEELGHLPERLRAPLVLCYLQGMTHELAAGQLGCPIGTVRSRLSRGRAQLLRRITRRGLTLSAAGLVSALESNARAAAIPPNVRITLIKLATGWVTESAAIVGGIGAPASVAVLLEGVLNVMRIKKLTIAATALAGLGALGFVIADQAAAVGGSTIQESAQGKHDSGVPHGEKDGRPVGALTPEDPRSQFVTQTYYVGDLVQAPILPGSVSTASTTPVGTAGPAVEERPKINVKPVMDLIASTVAPGTWQIDDASDQVNGRKMNRIVPFYLSISLIIRCPEDIHDQVANLLRGLRVLLEARDAGIVRPSPGEFPRIRANPSSEPTVPAASAPPPAHFRDSQSVPLPPHHQSASAHGPSRQRIQQLFDELQKEIQKLPQTVDSRSGTVQ